MSCATHLRFFLAGSTNVIALPHQIRCTQWMRQVDSSGPDKILLIYYLQSLPLLGHHYIFSTLPHIHKRIHTRELKTSSAYNTVGAEYNVLILITDFSVNPNCFKTENRYFQLTQSKAFSASKLAKTWVVLVSLIVCIKWKERLMLSCVWCPQTKPLWSVWIN